MYKGISLSEDQHVRFFDCYHLSRVNVWCYDGQWHVEENYGLMDLWTYQSTIVYSGELDTVLCLASDMAKNRNLFPVLYKGGKAV